MKVTFCGVRGSIPTTLSSEEVLNRILSQTRGDSISVKKLKSLAQKGLLGYGGDTSCVLLQDGDKHLIVDAGTGIRRINHVDLGNDIHILLTHLHWDHIQGLPFLQPIYMPNKKVHIHTSVDIRKVKAALKKQWGDPFFPVPYDAISKQLVFHQLKESGTANSFEIQALKMAHPFPTFGYKVSNGKSTYAHMSDTELTILKASEKTKYRKFLKDADFIVADSQFDPEEVKAFKTWGHSCIHHFIDLCANGPAKTLGLFHYNPVESEEKIDDIFKKAKLYLKQVKGGDNIKLINCIEGQSHQI